MATESNPQEEALAVPTGAPALPDLTAVSDWFASRYGGRVEVTKQGHREMQQDWQVEQRLGEIAQGRVDGSMTPEQADAAELVALRTMRALVYGRGMRVPLEALHEAAEGLGVEAVGLQEPLPYVENMNLHRQDPTQAQA